MFNLNIIILGNSTNVQNIISLQTNSTKMNKNLDDLLFYENDLSCLDIFLLTLANKWMTGANIATFWTIFNIIQLQLLFLLIGINLHPAVETYLKELKFALF